MGRVVFRNSAPFIRVRRGEVAALQNEEEFDALDDIRLNLEDEALLQVSHLQGMRPAWHVLMFSTAGIHHTCSSNPICAHAVNG